MLYMVIEEFRDPRAVYRRLRDKGRQEPRGVSYVDSWVTPDTTRCFQIMEADDRALLEEWMSQWRDLVEFEVVPIVASAIVEDSMAARL